MSCLKSNESYLIINVYLSKWFRSKDKLTQSCVYGKSFYFRHKKTRIEFFQLIYFNFLLSVASQQIEGQSKIYRKAKIVDSKKKRFCLVMSLYKISDLMTMFSSITFEDFFKDSKNPRNCSSK